MPCEKADGDGEEELKGPRSKGVDMQDRIDGRCCVANRVPLQPDRSWKEESALELGFQDRIVSVFPAMVSLL